MLATNDLFELLSEQIAIGAFDEISIKNRSSDALIKQSLVRLAETRDNSEVKSIPIPAILDQPALVAHLIPIKGGAHDIFSRAFAILVITPLHAPTAPTEDVLNGLFDLSPAERKAAQGIISGKTIDDVAAELQALAGDHPQSTQVRFCQDRHWPPSSIGGTSGGHEISR